MTRAPAHVPLSAILLIVGAVLCFTLLDTTVKVLAERYPVPLLVWARYAVQLLMMLLWTFPQLGGRLFRTRRIRMHVVRGAILPRLGRHDLALSVARASSISENAQ